MSTIIQSIEKEQLQRRPRFIAGDRVRVHFRVIEGTRTRTQVFEGVVIKRQGSGVRETFTVRKQSFGVGVERTFPLHSPKIEKLELAAHGAVRRAKLYYLRDRVGKAARVAERRWGIADEVLDTDGDGAIDAEGSTQVEAPQAVPAPVGEGSEDAPELTEVDAAEVEAAPEEPADATDEAPEAAGEATAEGASEPAGEPEGDTAEAQGSADEDEAPAKGA